MNRGKHMALMVIGRSTLPVSTRGKVGTMSVSIRENGQIGFSTSAGEAFKNYTNCTIGWDSDSRIMVFTPVNLDKLPKGVKKEDTFVVGNSKDEVRYISAASLMKHEAVAYDYKAAGTHSFPATLEGGKLSFTLPIEMAAKPKTPRKPKVAKAAAGASTTAAAPGAPAAEDELQEA